MKKIDLGFDTQAMISPKNREDYIAILEEASQMAEHLYQMWDSVLPKEDFSGNKP